jgi:sugar phosphate permease
MLGGGLLITALINIMFGFTHSVAAFTALWFLNGSFQVLAVLNKGLGLRDRPFQC